jgi:retron-type reverse transcriptase
MDLNEGTMAETKGSPPISTRLEPIANLAEKFADSPLTTLAHHIDIDWVREAHRRTRKDGARGIDGQSADEYAADLEGNLARLLERAKSGSYRAPAVRRTYIPKANGERRPLGIPTFEDKVLQRAVAMALEAVYEREFLDCSYGFGLVARRTKPWMRYANRRSRRPAAGRSRSTSESTSRRSTTGSCRKCFANGYATG